MTDRLPLIHELDDVPDVEQILLRLAAQPYCLFLDSAVRDPRRGRYSFFAADPFEVFQAAASDQDLLQPLEARLRELESDVVPELPPFQGGAAGLFGYDLNRSLERISGPRYDEFQVPALAVGFYDVVLAIDHVQQRAWLISQGFPERQPERRRERAARRLEQFLRWVRSEPARAAKPTSDVPLGLEQLAPQYPVRGPQGLTSNLTAEQYYRMIERAVEYIRAGDIFQVNLAQRLLYPASEDPLTLYLRLRRRNPAPFAGYFDLGRFQILSASPERFLSARDGWVEARPIKGTRQRTAHPAADLFAADDLRQSEKDRAENVMIVDLLRNDLSRVCEPETVQVTQLCEVETYQYVQHLVSAIIGRLEPGRTGLDLIRAAFPGGSITGAPKVRAMEIIAELEPTARGPYCGSLGYVGYNGATDLSILIRTITSGRGWWQMPVGGGIVVQSTPEREYDETWAKAEGLLRALR